MNEQKILSYIAENSSGEDEVLNELYRYTHLHTVNPVMVSGHLQGKLLELITFLQKPHLALEIGTFTGYSSICIARSLPKEGRLHTIEISDEYSDIHELFFSKAGVRDKIICHTGKAQNLVQHLGLKFDLIFIDGDKREYPVYYQLAKSVILPEGLIVADNVLWGGKVTDLNAADSHTIGIKEFNRMVKDDSSVSNLIIPIRDGISLIRMLP